MNNRLSRSENDVAYLLVSTSKKNQEIADQLFVTDKTIKFHITNIYKKLGIINRHELILKFTKYDFENLSKPGEEMNVNLPNINNKASQVVQPQKEIDQRDKINFIDEKFKVGKSIDQLHTMMIEVTKQEMTASNVNAACNCVSRINETINTAIQAARFLSGR